MASRRAYLRIFKDPDSSTGISVAVLVKNVRPKITKVGRHEITEANFKANFAINCDGYKVKPNVELKVWAQLRPEIVKAINKKKKLERAMAGSPMLFE